MILDMILRSVRHNFSAIPKCKIYLFLVLNKKMSSLLSQFMVVNLYSYTLFCGLCDITLSTFIQFFFSSFYFRIKRTVGGVRSKTKLSLSQITSNIFSFLFLLIQILWRYYYNFHTYICLRIFCFIFHNCVGWKKK